MSKMSAKLEENLDKYKWELYLDCRGISTTIEALLERGIEPEWQEQLIVDLERIKSTIAKVEKL